MQVQSIVSAIIQSTREHIAALNATADKIKLHLEELPPLKLQLVEISLPQRDEYSEEERNALRIAAIFRRAAERLREQDPRTRVLQTNHRELLSWQRKRKKFYIVR